MSMSTPHILPVYISTKDILDAKNFSLDAFMRYLNEEFRSLDVYFRRTPKAEIKAGMQREIGVVVQDCVVCLELYPMHFPLYENILFEEDLNAVKQLKKVKRLYAFLQKLTKVEWNLECFQEKLRAVCVKFFSGTQHLRISPPEKGQAPYAYLDSLQQQAEIYHANYQHYKILVQEYEKNIIDSIEGMQEECAILEKGFCNDAQQMYFESMLTWAEAINYDVEKRANLLLHYMYFLHESGQVAACYEVFVKHNTLLTQLWNRPDIDTITKNTHLADMHYHLGNYTEALALYQQALTLEVSLWGKDKIGSADIYNDIGLIYHICSDYAQAMQYFKKALSIYKAQEKYAGLREIITYQNIGGVYVSLGQYAKALEQYTFALSIKTCFPLPQLASLYNAIGIVHLHQENFDWATDYFEKALDIDGADLGLTSTNLAKVLYRQKRLTEAKAYATKAVQLRETMYGKKHIVTAQNYTLLGMISLCQNASATAFSYIQRALTIREEKLGYLHPSTAQSYYSLAQVHEVENDIVMALEFYTKAVSIQEQKLGVQHPSTIKTRMRINNIH